MKRHARALAAGLALLAVGCGRVGGGSEAGNDATGDADSSAPDTDVVVGSLEAGGAIALPSGSGLDAGTLSVRTGAGTVAVSNTRYVAPLFTAEMALAMVVDEAGDPVLAGFLRPADDNVIDARSTAAVSLYFALHLPQLPAPLRGQLLDELLGHAALDDLAAAFETAMAANPTVLTTADATLLAAVGTAVATLAADGGAMGRQAAALNAGNSNVLVEPSAAQSEVLVGPNVNGTGMQITNLSRRTAWYYVYETGFQDDAGNDVDTVPPKLLSEGLIQPTNGLSGTVSTLGQFLTGGLDFNPTSLKAAIALDVGEGQRRRYAEAIVAGSYIPAVSGFPGWYDAQDPRHAEWLGQARLMTSISFVRDVLFPVVFSIVSPVKGAIGGAADLPTWQGLAELAVSQVPAVTTQLDAGEWTSAVKTVLTALANNSALRNGVAKALRAVLAKATSETAEQALETFARANFLLAAVDVGIAAVDIGLVVDDLADARPLERWKVTAIKAKVLVKASPAKLDPGSSDSVLTAVVPEAGAADRFCFLWAIDEGPGTLSGYLPGPDTGSERSVVTEEDSALYAVDPKSLVDGDLARVTVQAFPRAVGEECAFPPSGGAIGEGRLGLLSSTKEPVVPCQNPWEFDREFWNMGTSAITYSISGGYGTDVVVSLNVPPIDKAGEEPYRDIQVYIPRPVSYDKADVTITGEHRFVQTERSDRILQLRPDDARGPVYLPGHLAVNFDGHGGLTVTVPTRATDENCGTGESGAPSCCPYWGYQPTWNEVYVGPLVYIQVQGQGYALDVVTAN